MMIMPMMTLVTIAMEMIMTRIFHIVCWLSLMVELSFNLHEKREIPGDYLATNSNRFVPESTKRLNIILIETGQSIRPKKDRTVLVKNGHSWHLVQLRQRWNCQNVETCRSKLWGRSKCGQMLILTPGVAEKGPIHWNRLAMGLVSPSSIVPGICLACLGLLLIYIYSSSTSFECLFLPVALDSQAEVNVVGIL